MKTNLDECFVGFTISAPELKSWRRARNVGGVRSRATTTSAAPTMTTTTTSTTNRLCRELRRQWTRGWRKSLMNKLNGAAKAFAEEKNASSNQGTLKEGKYHCTVDLLFGLVCFVNKNKNCQLSYSWFQTSQKGGQQYCNTFPFSNFSSGLVILTHLKNIFKT